LIYGQIPDETSFTGWDRARQAGIIYLKKKAMERSFDYQVGVISGLPDTQNLSERKSIRPKAHGKGGFC
jgi:hypothetical protein